VQPPIIVELQKENDELRKEIEQLKNGQKIITNDI
jgi:cell division protein FtsB